MDRQGGGKFEFRYSDPTQNWDRSRVKGFIANNVSVKDPKYSRALSTIIGGSWRNVITDNDETAKLILERGKLESRVTIIPLNKIQSRYIDNKRVAAAQRLVGKENAIPAIELLEYNKEVEPAIQHIFGSTFVCKDLETAKAVTYCKDVKTRSVTLDGDEMSPDGALAGGAVAQGLPVFDEISNIKNVQNQLNTKKRQCEEIMRKIDSLQGIAGQYRTVKDKLETVQLQLSAAKERIQQTAFQQDQNEIDELKNKIETLTKTIEECIASKASNEEKVKDLTAKLADSKGNKNLIIFLKIYF
jgi:structural maintenance of chromosome 2